MAASSASSVLYHVNPDEGAKPCGVTVGTCPYGADSPHFATEQEANEEFSRQMETQHDPFAPVKRDTTVDEVKKGIFELPPGLRHLDERLQELDYEAIYDYASSLPGNHDQVRRLVEARKENFEKLGKVLERINPMRNHESAVSGKTFMRFREESNRYRKETTILELAYKASQHRFPKTSVA